VRSCRRLLHLANTRVSPLSSSIDHPLSPALNNNKQCQRSHPPIPEPAAVPSASPSLDSSNLEQLKSEAVDLEGSKKHEEALAKYEEVLVIQQRDLPPGHLDTHETLTSIDRCIDQLKYASIDNFDVDKSAASLFEQCKHNDSYRLFEQTYQRLLVTHGADHPDTLTTRYNMALSLHEQKRWVDAHSMYEPLLKKMLRVLPLDHFHTLLTMVGLAAALCELERDDEALKIYENVVLKLISAFGEDHKYTLTAMVGMVGAQYNLRRDDDAKQTATRGLLIATGWQRGSNC
jgi:tetratricopeptide (TPR) repeat protein